MKIVAYNSGDSPTPVGVARIEKNPIAGLPVIVGGHPAPPELEMTPERVAEILMDVERESSPG